MRDAKFSTNIDALDIYVRSMAHEGGRMFEGKTRHMHSVCYVGGWLDLGKCSEGNERKCRIYPSWWVHSPGTKSVVPSRESMTAL